MTPKQATKLLTELKSHMSEHIVGQDDLVEDILVALFCEGHVLLEGPPWLAKTKTVKVLANLLGAAFSRIQFTPDLLPSDLLGSEVFRQKEWDFVTRKGPIFADLVLADEINRAPSKVQSALLQAMEEHQVTIGDQTFSLNPPFIILATQNPIEQDGTYPLSEAQTDRFMMKLSVDYPDSESEIAIMKSESQNKNILPKKVFTKKQYQEVVDVSKSIHVDEKIYDYIADIVSTTRFPQDNDLARYIIHGASPRASIAFIQASRARALMYGRDFVLPEDIKALAPNILRHRIIRGYEAIADDVTTDDIIDQILDQIIVP